MSSSAISAAAIDSGKQQLYDLASRLDIRRKCFEKEKDSRAIFTWAYVLITRDLADCLASGGFADSDWVVRLALHFAEKYVAALDAFDHHSPASPAWQEVFSTLEARRTTVLEDLVFAITAHIVHDLPLALTEVWPMDSSQVSRIHDFHLVNNILAKNIQQILDKVTQRYEPFLRWLDHLEEKHVWILTDYGIRISRGIAWYNAERLLDPKSQADAQAAINKSVLILVNDVRRPPVWSLRVLLKGLRWIVSFFRTWPKTEHDSAGT